MNKQTKIKSGVQAVLLVALAVLSATLPVNGQQKSKAELRGAYKEWLEKDVSVIMTDEEAAEFKGKPALELKLSTLTPALCIDSELWLELEIVNNGREAVSINSANLWTQFSYGFAGPEGSGRGGGMGMIHGNKGEEVLLQPGMIYRSSHKFSLADDFFADQGHYILKTRLEDSIYSNEIEFELFQCSMSKEVEDKDDN